MSAKEMLEKLGYEVDEQNDKEILYKMKWGSKIYWVSFVLERESFECFITSDLPIETYHSYEISIDLLQAINQQVKELGWK